MWVGNHSVWYWGTAFVLLLLSFSCSSDNASSSNEYDYYPAENVYYNRNNNIFYYSVDGGKTWTGLVANTTKEVPALGSSVKVYADTGYVYELNEQHRKQYNGTLLAIAIDEEENSIAGDIATEKELLKKPVSRKQPQAKPKEKKGIGKLINKIFGKKND